MEEVDAVSVRCLGETVPFNENQVATILSRLLAALEYVHTHVGIVHCGVRANNIVVCLDVKNGDTKVRDNVAVKCAVKLDGFYDVRRVNIHSHIAHGGVYDEKISYDMRTHWMPPEVIERNGNGGGGGGGGGGVGEGAPTPSGTTPRACG